MPGSLAFRQFLGYKNPKPNRGDSRTRKIWVPHKYKGQGRRMLPQLLCRRNEECQGSTRRDISLPVAKRIPF